MTRLLYPTDAYLRSFTATVTAVADNAEMPNALQLDQTAFYPGGGGQPHDTGTLTLADGTAYTVTEVKKVDGGLWHMLGSAPPPVGSSVAGEINWDRRYALMRTHTALHILCGVIWRDYGAQVTGGNMNPLDGRLDFEFERMSQDLVAEIETKINAEVAAGRDTRVQILPREEAFQIPDLIRTKINLLPEGITEVRTVEIIGLDLQADGGTHVANTREVGPLTIAEYKSKGKINKRIRLTLTPNPA